MTLAVFLRGKCDAKDVPLYMGAQIVGGVLAALAAQFVVGKSGTPGTLAVGPALVAEFLFTFALCYVVLNAATARANADNSFYGLAIGFTVMASAFAVGHVSGGAFNPAVAVAVSVMGLSDWSNIWIFLVADFAAGAAAAGAFKVCSPDDASPDKAA